MDFMGVLSFEDKPSDLHFPNLSCICCIFGIKFSKSCIRHLGGCQKERLENQGRCGALIVSACEFALKFQEAEAEAALLCSV